MILKYKFQQISEKYRSSTNLRILFAIQFLTLILSFTEVTLRYIKQSYLEFLSIDEMATYLHDRYCTNYNKQRPRTISFLKCTDTYYVCNEQIFCLTSQ